MQSALTKHSHGLPVCLSGITSRQTFSMEIVDHNRRREAMKRQRSGVTGSFSRNQGSHRNLQRVLEKTKDGSFPEDLVLIYRACARAA